jgi:hypothetical protein
MFMEFSDDMIRTWHNHITDRTSPRIRSLAMRFNILAVRVCLVAFLIGAALAGCKSSSTSGGDGSGGDNDPKVAQAKRISVNNLIQIGLALHNYNSAVGMFPQAGPAPDAKTKGGPMFPMPFGWRVEILPYLEQNNLYQLIVSDYQKNPQAPLSDLVTKTAIKVFQTPYGNDAATDTHYRVFVGNGAAFEFGRGIRITEISDGTSNTILVVEAAEPVSWSSVNELVYDPKKPLPKLGVFPGGFHALMADGSVRWIPSDTDEKTIRAMITRNGNEDIKLPGKLVERER